LVAHITGDVKVGNESESSTSNSQSNLELFHDTESDVYVVYRPAPWWHRQSVGRKVLAPAFTLGAISSYGLGRRLNVEGTNDSTASKVLIGLALGFGVAALNRLLRSYNQDPAERIPERRRLIYSTPKVDWKKLFAYEKDPSTVMTMGERLEVFRSIQSPLELYNNPLIIKDNRRFKA